MCVCDDNLTVQTSDWFLLYLCELDVHHAGMIEGCTSLSDWRDGFRSVLKRAVCLIDDGGGTPVQDEHQGSDQEEMRSDGNHSEVRLSSYLSVCMSHNFSSILRGQPSHFVPVASFGARELKSPPESIRSRAYLSVVVFQPFL